jgi:formamidopyrimidine-DNA glycosylase
VPELPEVETIRRHLEPHVEGRVLARLEVLDPRWTAPLKPHAVEDAVRQRTIRALGRRGKYLVWDLEDEVHLIAHLRMTGTMLLDPEPSVPYARVRFHIAGGPLLVFSDPRRFGTGELALGDAARDAFFAARLGPEPFDTSPAALRAAARGSRAPVKAFLLDQKRLAGVGNIYADEALHRAQIHPLRPAGRMTGPQWAALHAAVIDALQAGIAAKGASIDDFRDPYGVQGTFQDQFLVHRREGEACPRCGAAIRKLVVAGRGTYVCERCQPRPRVQRYAASASSARRPALSSRTSS